MSTPKRVYYGRFDASARLTPDAAQDLRRLAYEVLRRDSPILPSDEVDSFMAARRSPNCVEAGPFWTQKQKAANRVGIIAVNESWRSIAHLEVADVAMSERAWPFNALDFKKALSGKGVVEERAAWLGRLLIGDEMLEAIQAAGDGMNPLQVMMHIALATRDVRQVTAADLGDGDIELRCELARLKFTRESGLPAFSRRAADADRVRWVGPSVENALAGLRNTDDAAEVLDRAYAQLQAV